MINVSDDIKQAYENSTTQIDKIILNGEEHIVTNVEYYDDVYSDGNIFGTAIAKCLDFEIDGNVSIEGKEFEYLTGVKINDTIQWISLGNFIAQTVESNDTTLITKVSAMDYMLKSNIPYVTELNYASGTVTVLQVLQEACINSGLTLSTTTFANSNFVVDSNQFADGTLIRQVIQAAAQISGTVAKIKNNQLYLLSPGTTVAKVFTLNNYIEAEIKRTTHPINLVSLGMTDVEGENITLRDETSISKNGENSLVVNDNPFAYTQAKREQLITALFNAVKGFEYKSYSIKCQGLPYLETLDKIQLPDKEGNLYNSYVFRFNYKSPKGLESTIEAPSITQATVAYQNVPSALDVAKRAEYKVNKQELEIKQLISKTDAQSERITSITSDLNGVETRVSSTETKIENAESAIEETQADVEELDAKVDDEVSNLQSQIDGTIQFWNGSEIPTLSNEPASLWTTEEDKNNHRADLYTVIEDVDGELKQGKSYRFDKVGTTWTWVELTDNELSAVQALAASKAKVFVTTPKVPYSVGDLWLRNKELYECQTAKDASGVYSESDWVEATKYTDDTAAVLAQMTADQAIQNTTLTATTEEAKEFHIENSAESYCKSVDIYGESTQETRSGKNLIHLNPTKTSNGVTVTNNGDGTITVNGTAEVAMDFWIANGTYYLDSAYKHSFVTGDKLTQSKNVISGTSSGDWKLRTILYNSATQQTQWSTLVDDMTFTANFDGDTRAVELIIPAGATFSDLKIFPQLEVGQIATEPEMYGQTPSPEFESEIDSKGNKNLWDNSKASTTSTKVVKTDTGFEYVRDGETGGRYVTLPIKVFAGTTYNFSINSSNPNDSALYVYKTNVYGEVVKSGYSSINFVASATETLYFTIILGSLVENVTVSNIQIEKNTRTTFYTQHNHLGIKSTNKNLYPDGKTYENTPYIGTLDTTEKLFGNYSIKTLIAWTGQYIDVGKIASDNNLKVGDVVTLSIYFKANFIPDKDFNFSVFRVTSAGSLTTIVVPRSQIEVGKWIRINTKATLTEYSMTANRARFELNYYDVNDQYYYGNNRTNAVWFACPQVEVGEELTEYQDYEQHITEIPLLHPLRALPNGARDRIYWQDGKWYDEQNIGQKILNGSENISLYVYNNTNGIQITEFFNENLNRQSGMCNYSSKVGPYYTSNSIWCGVGSKGLFWVAILDLLGLSTVAEFKTWLAEHNTEIIYRLKTSIITEITDSAMIEALEHIRTFAGITNITSDASAKLTYYTNTVLNDEYETKLDANKKHTQTVEKFAEQEITNESIINSVSEVKTTIQNDYMSKEEASTQYTQLSKKFEFDVNTAIADLKNNGVQKVVSSIITIDENGLTSGRSDSEYYNVMNNTGNYQYNAGQLLAKYDKDGAEIPRLKSDIGVIAGIKHTKENVGGIIHHKTYVIE